MKKFPVVATLVSLLAAVPATARADVLWDLVHLKGVGGDLGTTTTITNPGNGSIVAKTSNPTYTHVYSALFDAALPNDEKGLGLCTLNGAGGSCDNSEIGTIQTSPFVASLILDFTGLIPGSVVTQVVLTSLQPGEGYSVFWSTDNVTYTALASGTGPAGCTSVPNACSVTLAVGNGAKYLRFDPVSTGSGGKDYLVQSVSVAIPEPGTMGLLATGLVGLTMAGFVRRRKK